MKTEDIKCLKVGSLRMTVKRGKLAEGDWGETDHGRQLITISELVTGRDEFRRLIIHEAIHVICEAYNLKALDDDDFAIDALATGLDAMLLDNPKLIKLYTTKAPK